MFIDPFEVVRKIKSIPHHCVKAGKTYNPSKRYTAIVRQYAKFVGDDDRAVNFCVTNNDWPEAHQEKAVEAIADMAEWQGYDFLEVWNAE